MSHAVERSISFYRLTTGPLRCLSAKNPCHLPGSHRRGGGRPQSDKALTQSGADGAPGRAA